MQRILFLILLFLFDNLAFSQNRYLKLIDKGEYVTATAKINKQLEKSPDDIALNYAMSSLLIAKNNKDYDAFKSYDFCLKAKSLFSLLTDEKELKRLNKIPINDSVFLSNLDTICKYGLSDAILKNKIDGYEEFLHHFTLSPLNYKSSAIIKRDLEAFKIARSSNTIDSYDYFIQKYQNATQVQLAISLRNNLAYSIASNTDNIESYKKFISRYPHSKEVEQAWKRIHELAFAEAKKINTSESFKEFMTTYPSSLQYALASAIYDRKQLIENTTSGNGLTYKLFIENFPGNSLLEQAKDSLYMIAKSTENNELLYFCIGQFTGIKRQNAVLLLHDLYTFDGETKTLDSFYSKFSSEEIPDSIKLSDYQIAQLGDELSLQLPYNSSYFTKYDNYIRLAAPKERAFVALQRIISIDLSNKDWLAASTTINNYLPIFVAKTKKLNDLIEILKSTYDNSIKTNAFGEEINSKEGDEYVPVVTSDDKSIYFCGKSRKDNLGGEDIYLASLKPKSKSKILPALSSAESNDAPVSISSDGTTMLLFKEGKLYNSYKTASGWSKGEPLPDQINSGQWQADAMISSDGNAMLFSSVREGNYDYFKSHSTSYHGEYNYPSDIYVSVKNKLGEWGNSINLGSTINTLNCDRSPFLHPDMKTLYFSSSGHGGFGNLDVFKSTRLSDTCWTCWSDPVNIGKEINSIGPDWGYKISTDGDKAYFSKISSRGDYDLYWLNLPPKMRPELVATVSGRLIDHNNSGVSSDIIWEDLVTGEKIGQSKSDPVDGSYFVILPIGRIYGYYVNKKDYFPISNSLDLRTNKKQVKIDSDIVMVTFKEMIENNQSVPINNLFFDFGKFDLLQYSIPELNRVSKILKNNNLKVEISGYTDNVGDDKSNQILSENRAMAAKDFLVKVGCEESNFIIVGYGKSKPVASNDTESGRAKNRRVEMRFVK